MSEKRKREENFDDLLQELHDKIIARADTCGDKRICFYTALEDVVEEQKRIGYYVKVITRYDSYKVYECTEEEEDYGPYRTRDEALRKAITCAWNHGSVKDDFIGLWEAIEHIADNVDDLGYILDYMEPDGEPEFIKYLTYYSEIIEKKISFHTPFVDGIDRDSFLVDLKENLLYSLNVQDDKGISDEEKNEIRKLIDGIIDDDHSSDSEPDSSSELPSSTCDLHPKSP